MKGKNIRVMQSYTTSLTKQERIITSLGAILAIINLQPYFIWETYSNIGFYIGRIILVLVLITYLLYICSIKIPRKKFLYVLFLAIYYIFINVNNVSPSVNLGGIISFTTIIFLVLLPNNIQGYAFKKFSIIFAVLLIFPIIFWILQRFGIDFSYSIIQPIHKGKEAIGYYYKNYLFALELSHPYYTINSNRLCGVFEEPGTIGTISAFLLVADKLQLRKNKWNLIILLGGILSFSLAFYLLLSIYLLSKVLLFIKKKIKVKYIILVLVISFFSLLFIPKISSWDYFNDHVIRRIGILNGKFIGDNRTNNVFEQKFEEMKNEPNIKEFLFGNGYGTVINDNTMNGSYSYKILIYDIGYLGWGYYFLLLFIPSLIKSKKNKDCLIFIVIFMISLYQRPYVISFSGFLILFGGISSLLLPKWREKDEKM